MNRETLPEFARTRAEWNGERLPTLRSGAAPATRENFLHRDPDNDQAKNGDVAPDADRDGTALIQITLASVEYVSTRMLHPLSGNALGARITSRDSTMHIPTRQVNANGLNGRIVRQVYVQVDILVILVFLQAQSRQQADAQYHDTTTSRTQTTYLTPAQHHQHHHHHLTTSSAQHAGQDGQTLTQDIH